MMPALQSFIAGRWLAVQAYQQTSNGELSD